ncbi:hypothetical protein C1637_12930 [Chryseobacterium lactis]|uniref:WD40 repeat domain-containing protein n=1 Tax=Chryseobacterium lactis TaxID=1241981 RepID=A0A3G6RKU7_CHRLC|nr:hypothetical protein [Chryseobacterium lactis]AZA80579.1 hypothetical protein EG342_01010 [Chryseobacterium lactis]AZB05581.1 hypothetical protein EG341_17135 [Chryseobacterium lactis]PNW13700.1 hypothetical protein C1637_12930 [Chryseobacterium lactis]
MIKQIIASALITASVYSFAQTKVTEGTKFTVDANLETNDKLVLADDYNSYMFSAINIDGLMRNVFPHKKLLMRKLDQNGSLVDTYVKDYANKTNGVLHNYLGSQQIDDDKFVAFTEEYFGKENRKEVFQHVFSKKDGTFITKSIAKYSIESTNKSGTTYVLFSENGKYAAVFNDRYSNKKTDNINDVLVLDLRTLSPVWNKEITLSNDYVEKSLTLTNSGKIVLLRKAAGWKEAYKLELVSNNEDKDLPFDDKYIPEKLYSISKNDNDYLISFGRKKAAVTIGASTFGTVMFYDLKSGKAVISNTNLGGDKDMNDVKVIKTIIKGDDILMAIQQETVTRPLPTTMNRFPDPVYKLEAGMLMKFNKEGDVTQFVATGASTGKRIHVTEAGNNLYISTFYPKGAFGNTGFSMKVFDFGTLKSQEVNLTYKGRNFFQNFGFADGNMIQYVPNVNKMLFLEKNGKEVQMFSVYNFIK